MGRPCFWFHWDCFWDANISWWPSSSIQRLNTDNVVSGLVVEPNWYSPVFLYQVSKRFPVNWNLQSDSTVAEGKLCPWIKSVDRLHLHFLFHEDPAYKFQD